MCNRLTMCNPLSVMWQPHDPFTIHLPSIHFQLCVLVTVLDTRSVQTTTLYNSPLSRYSIPGDCWPFYFRFMASKILDFQSEARWSKHLLFEWLQQPLLSCEAGPLQNLQLTSLSCVLMSYPEMMAVPLVIALSPVRMLKVVVFPAPAIQEQK